MFDAEVGPTRPHGQEPGETPSTHDAAGPTGPVTAAVRVGPSVFVVAGDRLWQADVAAFH